MALKGTNAKHCQGALRGRSHSLCVEASQLLVECFGVCWASLRGNLVGYPEPFGGRSRAEEFAVLAWAAHCC
eukprot:2190558-Pyramimonas_sp.AAC.1